MNNRLTIIGLASMILASLFSTSSARAQGPSGFHEHHAAICRNLMIEIAQSSHRDGPEQYHLKLENKMLFGDSAPNESVILLVSWIKPTLGIQEVREVQERAATFHAKLLPEASSHQIALLGESTGIHTTLVFSGTTTDLEKFVSSSQEAGLAFRVIQPGKPVVTESTMVTVYSVDQINVALTKMQSSPKQMVLVQDLNSGHAVGLIDEQTMAEYLQETRRSTGVEKKSLEELRSSWNTIISRIENYSGLVNVDSHFYVVSEKSLREILLENHRRDELQKYFASQEPKPLVPVAEKLTSNQFIEKNTVVPELTITDLRTSVYAKIGPKGLNPIESSESPVALIKKHGTALLLAIKPTLALESSEKLETILLNALGLKAGERIDPAVIKGIQKFNSRTVTLAHLKESAGNFANPDMDFTQFYREIASGTASKLIYHKWSKQHGDDTPFFILSPVRVLSAEQFEELEKAQALSHQFRHANVAVEDMASLLEIFKNDGPFDQDGTHNLLDKIRKALKNHDYLNHARQLVQSDLPAINDFIDKNREHIEDKHDYYRSTALRIGLALNSFESDHAFSEEKISDEAFKVSLFEGQVNSSPSVATQLHFSSYSERQLKDQKSNIAFRRSVAKLLSEFVNGKQQTTQSPANPNILNLKDTTSSGEIRVCITRLREGHYAVLAAFQREDGYDSKMLNTLYKEAKEL